MEAEIISTGNIYFRASRNDRGIPMVSAGAFPLLTAKGSVKNKQFAHQKLKLNLNLRAVTATFYRCKQYEMCAFALIGMLEQREWGNFQR